MKLRAILDASAVRAYAAGSIAVGELIGELRDEGVRFGLPGLCLIEGATGASAEAVALLGILAEHPGAELLPLDPSVWRQTVTAAELLGTVARACAALPVALGQADYVVTADHQAYPGLDVIEI